MIMKDKITDSLIGQREFFRSNKTKNIKFRLEQLSKLKKMIKQRQTDIEEALWKDLRKSPQEVYMTEISVVVQELDNHIRNLKKWARPQKVKTPIHLLPSSSGIVCEPLGVALIVAPWNYPFQLIINPLIGAISSGCCAMLKPSPNAGAIAALVEEMIKELFNPNYIDIVRGGREVNELLFKQKYDIIFFTGSTVLGKIVSKAAAENLTPVVLELGGKSPCIVDCDANLEIAARRIVWGKFINAGQTCIAPDYLFVHTSVKERLLPLLKASITEMYGEIVSESPVYPRIINNAAIDRLKGLMNEGDIYCGGAVNEKAKYIAPTIIDNIDSNSLIMQDEIFGPILPIMTFSDIIEVFDYLYTQEKPLALYYFGKDGDDVLRKTTSGGVCINDTLMHITNHNIPFGGVGSSGMGKYHGRDSFLAFSNRRGVVWSTVWIDMPFKYAPFKYFKFIKQII